MAHRSRAQYDPFPSIDDKLVRPRTGKITPATLPSALEDIETLLHRDLTPRLLRRLENFQVELEDAARLPNEHDKNQFKRLTKTKDILDGHINRIDAGRGLSWEQFQQLRHMRLSKLLLDYGEYFPRNLDELRSRYQFDDAPWASVLSVVNGEDSEASDAMKRSLQAAATESGCTHKLLLFEMQTYGTRHRCAHSDVEWTVVKSHWDALAEKIIRDKGALSNLIHPNQQDEYDRFMLPIERVEARFFEFLPLDEPQLHQLSPLANRLRRKAIEQRKKRDAQDRKIQRFQPGPLPPLPPPDRRERLRLIEARYQIQMDVQDGLVDEIGVMDLTECSKRMFSELEEEDSSSSVRGQKRKLSHHQSNEV